MEGLQSQLGMKLAFLKSLCLGTGLAFVFFFFLLILIQKEY